MRKDTKVIIKRCSTISSNKNYFTASHEAYADAVIDYLDPKKELVQHRLYRRHCDYIYEGYYVKDLRLLNRDLSRMVFVDNAAYSYAFQVDNGSPAQSHRVSLKRERANS